MTYGQTTKEPCPVCGKTVRTFYIYCPWCRAVLDTERTGGL